MSSSPSSSPPTPTGVPAATAAPESSSAGFRLHGEMDHTRISEAGPALDKRSERRRPTLTGSDRKRRLVNTDGDVWSRRVVSGPAMDVASSHHSDLESRRISHSSSSSQTPSDMALPGSSYAAPIDLSSSPPSNTQTQTQTQTYRPDSRRSSWTRPGADFMEYVRPRWQPDSEVTNCPICGMPFSFWYRKHHCRKCGRVVCSSCSPHRITIPRQFIVHPPDPNGPSAAAVLGSRGRPSSVVDLDADDSAPSPTVLNPALGGGEEVRLCNPCVPDPNPEPPRGYGAMRAHEGLLRGNYPGHNQARHRSYHSISSGRPAPYGVANDPFFPRPTRRTIGSNDYPGFSGFGGSYGSRFHERPVDYYGSASAGSRYAHAHAPARSSVHSLPHLPTGSANLFTLDDPSLPPPVVDGFGRTPTRPTVPERDLCPVCDQQLPSLGANGNEDAREAHIRGCIDSHGRGRSPQPATGTGTSPVAASSSTPVRMISFPATEKDCLGQDGGTQECTICMEDYEVGQSLVRLECLCKFHKRCIAEWFGRKRECPVHKVS